MCVCSVDQLCPAFCHAYGILQARILEQVAISSSRGSSRPGDQTHSSCVGRQICLPLSRQGSSNNIGSHGYKMVSHYLTWSSLEPEEVNRTSCYWYLIIVIEGIQTFPEPQERRLKSRLSGPSGAPVLWTQTAALLQP